MFFFLSYLFFPKKKLLLHIFIYLGLGRETRVTIQGMSVGGRGIVLCVCVWGVGHSSYCVHSGKFASPNLETGAFLYMLSHHVVLQFLIEPWIGIDSYHWVNITKVTSNLLVNLFNGQASVSSEQSHKQLLMGPDLPSSSGTL